MFGQMIRNLIHRINPMTMIRETAQTVTDRVIPQGAAELAQGLVGNAANNHGSAYVPYGHAQAPVPVSGNWSDRFTSQGQSGAAQARGSGMGM
jgi:hypothetical protein